MKIEIFRGIASGRVDEGSIVTSVLGKSYSTQATALWPLFNQNVYSQGASRMT